MSVAKEVRPPDFGGRGEDGRGLFFIAGPCMMESRELVLEVAERLVAECAARGADLIFKSSFDKANRTSGGAARGMGMEAGLALLGEVRSRFGVAVLTDVHLPEQAGAAADAGVDVLQVPAFLCRQTDLIAACAATGRAVLIKKGQFLSPWEALRVGEKAREFGAREVALCERGTTFGYNNLVADMRGLAVMRGAGFRLCLTRRIRRSCRGRWEGRAAGSGRWLRRWQGRRLRLGWTGFLRRRIRRRSGRFRMRGRSGGWGSLGG